MTRYSDWTSPDINQEVPSAARLYDYYLGGACHFAADRELGDRILKALPDARFAAQRNRAFVVRAVRRLAEAGYTQFIDVGCGLPTAGAVHEIVRKIRPLARVVYVDNEPVAIEHAKILLTDVPGTGVVAGDLRAPGEFLNHPTTLGLLDYTQPIVLVAAAVMHFVTDQEDPAGVMAEIRRLLSPGSPVVFSHGTAGENATGAAAVVGLYEQSSNHAVPRTRGQVEALLAGFELLPPGVQWVTQWWPDEWGQGDDGPRTHMYGAIACVPGGADMPGFAERMAQLPSAAWPTPPGVTERSDGR
jgi:SAM-dependent methyltransferase